MTRKRRRPTTAQRKVRGTRPVLAKRVPKRGGRRRPVRRK